MKLESKFLGENSFEFGSNSNEFSTLIRDLKKKYQIEIEEKNIEIRKKLHYSLIPMFKGSIVNDADIVKVSGFFKVRLLGITLIILWYILIILLILGFQIGLLKIPNGDYLPFLIPISLFIHFINRYNSVRTMKKMQSDLREIFK